MIRTETVPVREDEAGALRVGETRVLLELVVRAFEDGAAPEMIVQRYETLTLADAYSVIAYYLRHQEEITEYLGRREREAEAVKAKIEAAQGDVVLWLLGRSRCSGAIPRSGRPD